MPARSVVAMRLVIAGGHGQIARSLERLLAARGDQTVAIIGNPAQADEVAATGAEPVVCDLESAAVDDVAKILTSADALVFAAGTGHVTLAATTPAGSVTRDDVATVIAARLDTPRTAGLTVELIGGQTPIAEAVRRAVEL